jgi:hypothetical protein
MMRYARQSANVVDTVARLVLDGSLSPFSNDEMRFHIAALEHLKQSDSEDRAGRPGQAHNQSPLHVSILCDPTPPRSCSDIRLDHCKYFPTDAVFLTSIRIVDNPI